MAIVHESIDMGTPREVPKPLTGEQVDFFVSEGYLIVEELVSPIDCEAMCTDVLKLARGGYECENVDPLPATATDADVLKDILCIHQPHYASPVMRKYVEHPTISGMLSQIAGAHLPYWDGSVNCMQSMFFVKPPGFQGQAWHQDEIYIPTRDRSLVGAWIALDDATIENGCLWVIPRSHRNGMLWPQHPHGNEDEFDFTQESYGFDESEEIAVEVPRGSVVFFNGYLLHRSRKNRSASTYRRVLVNHYCNAWSRLPWGVPDGQSPATANIRRGMVHVAGIDPYAWQGKPEIPNRVHMRRCKANAPLERKT